MKPIQRFFGVVSIDRIDDVLGQIVAVMEEDRNEIRRKALLEVDEFKEYM